MVEFGIHPSDELVQLFREKPYQGQNPYNAKIIFLSSDANYSPEISNNPFFDYILEYQNNGIEFWEKHECHHPFLLPDYPFDKRKNGRPFHKNFSELGLTKDMGKDISFIELLDIPTVGNKSQNISLFYNLITEKHMKNIDELILNTNGKLIFVSQGVLKNLFNIKKTKKQYNVLNWLDFNPSSKQCYSQFISGNEIHEIYHFSSPQIHNQISKIKTEIHNWLKEFK